MNNLSQKKILLIICGGISAYKSLELIRLLKKQGAHVQVLMTPSSKNFVTPLTLSTLSNKPVISDFFDQNDENKVADRTGTPLPHIKPSGRWSPVNSPEQRGRRRTHREGKMDDDKRHGRGIRPVLHRLNAKLRRGRGRRRSKSREPRERSQTRSGTVMSELPTITNLAIEI